MRHLVLIAMAVLTASESAAQLTRPNTRERAVRAVVDSFFTAVEREHWDSAAAFVDTARFGAYLKQQVREARAALPVAPMTVEQYMANDSTMPRAVAEWQMQQYLKSGAPNVPFPSLTYEFFGVETPQQLVALSTAQALVRWLEARDERVALREMAKRSGCPSTVAETLRFQKSEIRAVAFAGDTAAYVIVVAESPMAPPDPTFTERVLALHPIKGTWRLEPRRNLLNNDNGASIFCVHD